MFLHGSSVLVGLGHHTMKVSRSYSMRHTTFSRTPLDEW